jgi:Na+-driven multidrug efflux pump
MSNSELRALRLSAVILIGIATFQAAAGRWASAAAVLGLLLIFSVGVVWRSKRSPAPQVEPEEAEARVRRLAARVMPLLLVFFIALTVYNVIDGDWFGAGHAAFCFAVALIGLYLNRRWLAQRPRRKA